jgi:hypothetical protein
MTRTDPNRSERSTPALSVASFSPAWPIALVAVASAFILAHYSTMRIESNAFGGPSHDLLRAHLLVVAVILGSVFTFATVSWRGNKVRGEVLEQANADLRNEAASVWETNERFRMMFHGNPSSGVFVRLRELVLAGRE